MKRYKLKKWYPSLPRRWDVGDIFELEEEYSTLRNLKNPPLSYKCPVDEVKKYPEFWEELETKGYKVIEIRRDDGKTFDVEGRLCDGQRVLYNKDGKSYMPPKQAIEIDHYNIHSVMRLSDSKVFSIGDMTVCGDSEPAKIVAFHPSDEYKVYPSGLQVNTIDGCTCLSKISHYKNYEILSFSCDKHDRILRMGIEITLSTAEEYANKPSMNIHSVKRLSDGKVFTIGDNIENQFGRYTITEFKLGKLEKGKLVVHTDGNNAYLSETQHLPEPLFTTEDGVDIYEGDNCWCVKESNSRVMKVHWSINHPKKHLIYFSTKKLAEKHVDDHKIRYSKADIREALKEAMSGSILDKIFKPYKFRDYLDL